MSNYCSNWWEQFPFEKCSTSMNGLIDRSSAHRSSRRAYQELIFSAGKLKHDTSTIMTGNRSKQVLYGNYASSLNSDEHECVYPILILGTCWFCCLVHSFFQQHYAEKRVNWEGAPDEPEIAKLLVKSRRNARSIHRIQRTSSIAWIPGENKPTLYTYIKEQRHFRKTIRRTPNIREKVRGNIQNGYSFAIRNIPGPARQTTFRLLLDNGKQETATNVKPLL